MFKQNQDLKNIEIIFANFLAQCPHLLSLWSNLEQIMSQILHKIVPMHVTNFLKICQNFELGSSKYAENYAELDFVY